jgi:hypothetical protein
VKDDNGNRVASCGCGQVRITVEGDPQNCWVCHCDYCQRATGSIGQLAAVYREEDVVSVEGETTTYGDFPKYPGAEKYFCSRCGTGVHWINPAALPGMHMVAIGCFADPDFPGPRTAAQTQYRHSWCPPFASIVESFEVYRDGPPVDQGGAQQ